MILRFIALRGLREHENVEHSQRREYVIYWDRSNGGANTYTNVEEAVCKGSFFFVPVSSFDKSLFGAHIIILQQLCTSQDSLTDLEEPSSKRQCTGVTEENSLYDFYGHALTSEPQVSCLDNFLQIEFSLLDPEVQAKNGLFFVSFNNSLLENL